MKIKTKTEYVVTLNEDELSLIRTLLAYVSTASSNEVYELACKCFAEVDSAVGRKFEVMDSDVLVVTKVKN